MDGHERILIINAAASSGMCRNASPSLSGPSQLLLMQRPVFSSVFPPTLAYALDFAIQD
jgi:hypothetical protein